MRPCFSTTRPLPPNSVSRQPVNGTVEYWVPTLALYSETGCSAAARRISFGKSVSWSLPVTGLTWGDLQPTSTTKMATKKERLVGLLKGLDLIFIVLQAQFQNISQIAGFSNCWELKIQIPSPGNRSIEIAQQAAKPPATADLPERRKRRDLGLNDSVWFANKVKWEGPASVGLVEPVRGLDGKTTVEPSYYLSSLKLDVVAFASAVQGPGASKANSTGCWTCISARTRAERAEAILPKTSPPGVGWPRTRCSKRRLKTLP